MAISINLIQLEFPVDFYAPPDKKSWLEQLFFAITYFQAGRWLYIAVKY